MQVEDFIDILGGDFYAGVPDSLLKPLCNYLMHRYGESNRHHVIAANEGNAVALAAGYYLSTGRIPIVYMQNSGEGNIINPVASLLSPDVYGIPEIFVIGWRGEPGKKDEPQHAYQGKITLSLLEMMQIPYFVLSEDTLVDEVAKAREQFADYLNKGQAVAFVVKNGALKYDKKASYKNKYSLIREEVIKEIIAVSDGAPIVSTTGKTSRELYELREQLAVDKAGGCTHNKDFLTVGSMGHSSSIALGIALQKPGQDIWCLDGDGASIMHMGAMATIGKVHPDNFIHILINNEAHESVGGLPTAADRIDFLSVAKGCGYDCVWQVRDMVKLRECLQHCKEIQGLRFLEVKVAIGSRQDLGRPGRTPQENKRSFMHLLSTKREYVNLRGDVFDN